MFKNTYFEEHMRTDASIIALDTVSDFQRYPDDTDIL